MPENKSSRNCQKFREFVFKRSNRGGGLPENPPNEMKNPGTIKVPGFFAVYASSVNRAGELSA